MRAHIVERDSSGAVKRQFIEGKLLGKGGFAKCYQVTDCATNEELAVKMIDKASLTKPKTKQKLLSEIKIHSTMRHPNVVHYRHCFEDDHYVYILLELCTEQTLMEHSKRKRRFSESETSYLMNQCIKGIRYMHDNAVIHRDLKLSNLLLSDKMEVKIADFGLATQLDYDGERKRTVCGTPNYIAPEILEGGHRGHSFEVDVWSLGVIMYTLLVGKPPFEMADMKSTYKRICQVSYSFPANLEISSEARNLIRRILQADPERRPNLAGIEADPFFTAFPPPSIAPLSLFQPGTANYYAQERRLAETEGYTTNRQARSPMSRMDYLHNVPHRSGSVPRATATSTPRGMPNANPGYLSSGARSSTEWSPGYRGSSLPASRSPSSRSVREGLAPPVLQGGSGQRAGSASMSPSPHHPRTYGASASPQRSSSVASKMGTEYKRMGSYKQAQSGMGVGGQPGPYQHQHQGVQQQPRGVPAPATPEVAMRSPSALSSPYRAFAKEPSVRRQESPSAPMHRIPSAVSPPVASHRFSPKLATPPQVAPVSAPMSMPFEPYATPQQPAQPAPNVAVAAAAAVCAEREDEEERQNLTTMHDVLERTMTHGAAPVEVAPQPEVPTTETSVTRYADFTSKYGLAYLLNNGNVGVSFNDSTKMVWTTATNSIQYVSRGRAGAHGAVPAEDSLYCTIDDYPETLRKKITLITYFRNYLTRSARNDQSPEVVSCSRGKPTIEDTQEEGKMVYIKRWLKTKYAIIFRLSNKSVQVWVLWGKL